LLLTAHVVSERVALEVYGLERGYAQALYSFWVASTERGVLQAVGLIVAWVHGCIGVFFWLRLKRFYQRAAPALFAAAVLLPTLALLGFYQGGRTVVRQSTVTQWQEDHLSPGQLGTPEQVAGLLDIRERILKAWAFAIALVLLARGVRSMRERRRGLIRVSYPDGRSVRAPRG
jgi:adenylate cyclase